ncbi:MAG: 23S rRNA (pseudouridine(1915)-N(3))-methyltransferase RlmH [Candidatus Buchananbacteria bacterium]
MQKITILAIGKIKTDYFAQAAAEYLKRLKSFVKVEIRELPALSFSSANQVKVKKEEGRKLQEELARQKGCRIVILDEHGKQFTSPDFSQFIFANTQPLVLVIGGSLGLTEELFKAFPQAIKLSLAAMTLPHELARVVLLEQLYRAVTIAKKMTYHY